MREIDCRRADGIDLAALYLAGRLPEDDAEAFEAHYLGCERCASALREAGEIRAALGQSVLAPESVPSRSVGGWRDIGTLLAAAATVAAFFFGMRQVAEREPVVHDGVLRSASAESVNLSIASGPDGTVVLAWPAHARAHSYRFEIVRSDGVPVLKSETGDRRVVLAVSDLPPRPESVTLLARVEALDALGQVVAASAPRPLPAP
jgi:Putative zinc-finger